MTPEVVDALKVTEEYIDFLHAWSVDHDLGHVVGCAGFRPLWKGVWEAWLHSNDFDTFFHNRFTIIRHIRCVIHNMFKYEHAYRIQAVVRADNLVSLKFHKLLGFEQEGVMRKYGPDKSDFIMHSIIQ